MTREFGPYDITRELGRGAMGVVYLAVQRSLQRECALKTISLKLKDSLAAERFIQEGQSVARLGKHPNIVQVFDAGVVNGTPYIAMEFVEGETLDAMSVRLGPLRESELIEYGRKVALALDHAHRRGIVHRDVKPANLLVDREGEPQLLDFGIAKDLNSSGAQALSGNAISGPGSVEAISGTTGSEQTLLAGSQPAGARPTAEETATVVLAASHPSTSLEVGIQGTPAFMAPEQADPRRGPVNACSDVYALGATLYVLATARRPFEANTMTELLAKVVREEPPPPHQFVEISPDLEAVILKALEKEPQDRYQTALEFADDLSRVEMGLPTHARKLGRLGWLWRRVRVYSKLLAIVAIFVVFAGVLSSYFLFRSREIQTLWNDIAERIARSSAQEVRSLLDPALPMLEECVALSEAGLLPVDRPEDLARHFVARFRYHKRLSWLSYGDAEGRFTGVWRDPAGRIVVHRSWLDDQGGHVREAFADGARERLRWNDEWTYDPRQRPFYQLASDSSVPVWTEPYEWFAGEGLGITAAMALRKSESQQVRGVFTADYHLTSLSDFLANLRIGGGGRAYLLGEDGDLLASPDREASVADPLLQTAIHQAEIVLPGGIEQLPEDEPQSFTFQYEGSPYLAALEAFQPAAGLPIVTAVLVPEDNIIGPVRESALRTARLGGGIALLAILSTVLGGIWQRRRLMQRLKQRPRRRVKAKSARTASVPAEPDERFAATQVTDVPE